jgi:N utilization substance protein B
MKKTRRYARELALQSIYQIEFWKLNDIYAVMEFSWCDKKVAETTKIFAQNLVQGTFQNTQKISHLITQLVAKRKGRLSTIDKAILKLAMYELAFTETDYKVIINEALELCKRYSDTGSVCFINGVLDEARKKLQNNNEFARQQNN